MGHSNDFIAKYSGKEIDQGAEEKFQWLRVLDRAGHPGLVPNNLQDTLQPSVTQIPGGL